MRRLFEHILFIISSITLHVLLSTRGGSSKFILGLISVILFSTFLSFKSNFSQKVKSKLLLPEKIVILAFSFIGVSLLSHFFMTKEFWLKTYLENSLVSNQFFRFIAILMSYLSLYSVSIYYSYIYLALKKPLIDLVNSINKKEMCFIIILIVIIFITSLSINERTNVFIKPQYNNELLDWDVVYTLDSPYFVKTDVYTDVKALANDIRQPYFGFFALPFGVLAFLLSEVIFFIPNSYIIMLLLVQGSLLGLCGILLCRLLSLSSFDKFFFIVLYSVSYPFIIFALSLEQYVIPVFYLLLYIYVCLEGYEQNTKDIAFIASTGSLLTSGVLFPLLVLSQNIKKSIATLTKTALKFFSPVLFLALIPIYPEAPPMVEAYRGFAGYGLSFMNKLMQFINFVPMALLRPVASLNYRVNHYVSFRINEVNSINLLGVLILIVVFISFFIHRKNKFIRISFYWVVFSFFVLCVIGWGTSENGLFLYSLYFSWAYISLIFMFIKRCFGKRQKILYSVLSFIIIALAVVNVNEFLRIIRFGIKYYGGY